tara:strand:- start:237 stop:1367 length:1131 start_codon:yes stop_codon:yes gene_type:complete
MKHKTLTILIFLSYLYTQNVEFSQNFSFDSNHTTFKIFSDSLYYIVSNMADEKHIKKTGIIVAIDERKKMKNLIKLGKKNNYILSGIKTENGDFLFVGYNKSNNDEWNKIYVVKTDKNLNLIWENSYGALNNDNKGYAVVELNNDEFWVLAYTKTSKNGALILKIDGQGNEKWFSYLPDLKCNFANNMISINTKELIISGQNSNQLFVSKINNEGEILWQYNYFDDNKYHRAYDIKKTTDNGIIIAGNSTKTEDHSYDVLLIKLSENGQEEWTQTFGNNTNEVAYDIEQNKQLEYIISGYALIDKKEKIYNSFIIKTDSIGNVMKRLDFNEKKSNQLYDINIKYNDKTKTESYIGTGNIFNEYGNSEIWLIKAKLD